MVPSASLGWKLTQMSNLRLGYDMRIYRPGIWYLNPYLNDSNPTSISQGNSQLDNEKSHSFVLSYSNFTPKLNFNASLRYGTTNNSIERVTRLVRDTDIPGLQNPTGKDVLYATYENIGHSKYVNLTAYVNWNASPQHPNLRQQPIDLYRHERMAVRCTTTAGASLPLAEPSRRCPRTGVSR